MADILKMAGEELSYMQGIRRILHRQPELSHYEYRTRDLIIRELEQMGVPYTVMAETGVVALIEGKGPGKTVLLRADMDALPIQEASDCPFPSEVPNVMHACAHDGHVAGLLGAVKLLNALKEEFGGAVKIVFQPSEEYDSGAKEMVDAGVLRDPDVDCAVSCHLWGRLPYGKVGVKSGAFMAAPDAFKVTIHGKGGHGSTPQLCDDVVLMACEAVPMIYAALQRKVSAFESVLVSICSVHAGTGYNILPDTAEFVGTIRHYDPALRNRVIEVIAEVLEKVTTGTDASFKVELDDVVGPVINDPAVTEAVRDAAVRLLGEDRVLDLSIPETGADDFSFITEAVPGCYFYVGLEEDPKKPIVHHSAEFAWNDEILATSCAMLVQSALALLA